MRRTDLLSFFFFAFALAATLAAPTAYSAEQKVGLDKTEYRVFIVIDGLRQKFVDVQTGFQDGLTKSLAAEGAYARYTVFDTKADPATVPGIIRAIQDGQPDLICVINNSSVFADTNITRKLTDSRFKFVTENCMPVQSGVARSWEKPGGNVTGVGVFVQFNSMIRLARAVNPKIKKWAFASWNAVKDLNEFLEAEVRAAAKAEGVELIEFRRLADSEEEIEFYKGYVRKPDTFVSVGISAYVRRDGKPTDAAELREFMKTAKPKALSITYDEFGVQSGDPAGTCVIWYDLGAQLADKGLKVLKGAAPGDLAWDYPRKYNIVLNLQSAEDRGFTLPQSLIGAAYKVFTDYDGHFVGRR